MIEQVVHVGDVLRGVGVVLRERLDVAMPVLPSLAMAKAKKSLARVVYRTDEVNAMMHELWGEYLKGTGQLPQS